MMMQNKAISTVIATVLMLMIVIALGGTAYLFISGTFTSKTATTFEVIDAINDTVIIRNSGTDAITSFSSVKIDNEDAVYRVSTQDPSLVLHLKMDESSWISDCASETVIDSSGRDNNGKACGATPVQGKFGNAGDFDGDNSIVLPANQDTSLKNTVSTYTFWINSRDTVIGNFIASAYSGDPCSTAGSFNIDIVSDGIRICYNAGEGVRPLKITTPENINGQWYYFAVIKDHNTNTISVYKNGLFEGSDSFTAFTPSNSNPSMGNNQETGNPADWFVGSIEEVKIYNRTLSKREIKAVYNIGDQINPGEKATIKVYNQLSKGTHTLRLCTSSMCNVAILTII